MNILKIATPILSLGALVISSVVLKKKSEGVMPISDDIIHQEELFGGVPLSKLDELAKEVFHGINCTIDKWGFLVFKHRSKRGHQINYTQMKLDETGKLINLGVHYPGELWSLADEFAKKANERFEFKK